MPGRTFYITTPIYYPNAEPHLGHVYTTLCADAVARYHRLVGDDTFFLTGTDEHGVKMVKTAAEQGIEPRELADRNVAVFENLWRELKVSHDGFIRTTSDVHRRGVQEVVRRLVATDDIYLGGYEGWYDEGQEEFVTETEAKERNYTAFNKKPLVRYKEPSYFFRLGKYASRVLAHIEAHPEFIQPESRRNEVLSKLRAGVEDLSVSRATLKWGIPLPHDPEHVVYVWIDALSNYVTALGYGSDAATQRRSDEGEGGAAAPDPASRRRAVAPSLFETYWPADVHLIGKEIMWFHTVYWPAMLLALGLPLPRQVFAHGWWTSEGEKMSKTRGNFIDLAKLRGVIANYSLDALRYYLLRAAPFGNDLDWKGADFSAAFNELANVLGNCLNRIVNMTNRYRGGALPPVGERESADDNVVERTARLADEVADAYRNVALQQCALVPIELARAVNGYIDATAPFKLAKDPARSARLDTVLHLSAQAVYRALVALLPIMPEKAAEGLAQLGVDTTSGRTLGQLLGEPLPVGHRFAEGKPLFPKVEAAR